jgi:hypothetical protein
MKTIKQIREEYDSNVLEQNAPDELMLEGRESDSIKAHSAVPSFNQMPAMLLFRRIAYRLYPKKQVVALYYSKTVDKYLSVPFGPEGNLNLSESNVFNTYEDYMIDEGAKWEAAKGALSGAIHGTIRGGAIGGAVAPGPGTALGAVIGGVRGAIKGGKRGYEKGKAMEEDWSDAKYKNPEGGLTKAGVMRYRRENPGSKLQTAVTTKPSKLKKGSKAANRRKSFCARMGGMKKRLTSAKTARDSDSRINKALRKWNCEESFKQKLAQMREGWIKDVKDMFTANKDVNAYAYGSTSPVTPMAATKPSGKQPKVYSGFSKGIERHADDHSIASTRYKQKLMAPEKATVKENKISDIQNMLSEGVDAMDLSINGRTITLNNSMAKKIIRVYESVNTKNKKIVESMLNEDLDSFKKLLNFSIKA